MTITIPEAGERFARELAGPVPADLVSTRVELHRLATYVIAPARFQHTQRFGLRVAESGFATPPFVRAGEDVKRIIEVSGRQLVVHDGDERTSTPLTTLRSAAEFLSAEVDANIAAEDDSPPIGDVDAQLEVSADGADFLAAWWNIGDAVLEQLRCDDDSVDPSIVQLWPGHFDPAIEVGDDNRRASIGASPGDGGSDEPYLYVSVWWPERLDVDAADPFWNADGYVGSTLKLSELVDNDEPVEAALEFVRGGRDRLASAEIVDAVGH